MTLQSNGPISLSDIQVEFGGTNPISLSEYYNADNEIPTAGEISLNDFYGASQLNSAIFPSDWTTQFNRNINSFYTASGTKSVNISPFSETVTVTLTGSRATAKHNGGVPESGPWTVSHGDTFQIRLQASSSYSSSVSGTLTIQETGDQLRWTIWTEAEPV